MSEFTTERGLWEEVGRLRAELAEALANVETERDWGVKAEAAIARVRALCVYRPADFHTSEPRFGVHEILRALDGEL